MLTRQVTRCPFAKGGGRAILASGHSTLLHVLTGWRRVSGWKSKSGKGSTTNRFVGFQGTRMKVPGHHTTGSQIFSVGILAKETGRRGDLWLDALDIETRGSVIRHFEIEMTFVGRGAE